MFPKRTGIVDALFIANTMRFIDLKLFILDKRISHLKAGTRARFVKVLHRLKRRRDHVWSELMSVRDLPEDLASPAIEHITLEWEAIDRSIARTLRMLRLAR